MNAKEKYVCGTCKWIGYCEYLTEEYTCKISGEQVSEDDTCDNWTDPDEPELTEEERYDGGVMSNFDNENPKEVEDYINEGNKS